ncbi:MAG: peptidoglycan editing factor PgeF [Thioalkalispiraceae bacterium]
MASSSWIPADWPAPQHVRAGTTTRLGGLSEGVYSSLNLALHVGDDKDVVNQNRQKLKSLLNLPAEPHWLKQVHGCQVSTDDEMLTEADASVTTKKGRVCVVMIADCLPVLITDRRGTCVAAAHAGWRGLEQQVIARTVQAMSASPEELLVWLGPAIGPQAFEVGNEVRDLFLLQNKKHTAAFIKGKYPGKWLMDVYAVARLQLAELGVVSVSGGDFCTYQDQRRFYSYRRDNITGRMASLIWMI